MNVKKHTDFASPLLLMLPHDLTIQTALSGPILYRSNQFRFSAYKQRP